MPGVSPYGIGGSAAQDYSLQENIQFCRQARGSLSELIDDINICLDEKYGSPEHLESLKEEAYRVNKQLNGYVAYLKKRKQEDAIT
ncbi:MAG TPA: four helix bundle protein [Syntrophorhabdales bacterium]|nr:four helix bundle protein [Syntrophorhabdales bacterium]